jgi:translocation and assembly module TamB
MADLPGERPARAPVDPTGPVAAEGAAQTRTDKAPVYHQRAAPVRRSRRRRFRGPGLFGGFPLFLLVLLLWLSATQSGLRTLLGLVVELAPDQVQVGHVEGRLLGRIAVNGLSIRLPAVEVRIRRIDLDWSPFAILSGTLSIAEIRADVDLVLKHPERRSDEAPVLPKILLPLRLELGRALIEPVRVFRVGDETPLRVVDRVELAGDLEGARLDLERILVVLSEPAIAVQGSGQATLIDRYPLDLVLDWELSPSPDAQILGHTRLAGDLARLEVRSTLTGDANLDLDLEMSDLLSGLTWDGEISIFGLDLPAFAPGLPEILLIGALAIGGGPGAAEVTGMLEIEPLDLPAVGRLRTTLDLLWEPESLRIRLLDLSHAEAGARLSAKGRIGLDPGGGAEPTLVRLDLESDWDGLRWPLVGDPILTSGRGRLVLSGTPDLLDYLVNADAEGPGWPAARISGLGRVDRQGARLAGLEIAMAGGRVAGAGDLSWQPAPAWDLALVGRDLDPGALMAAVGAETDPGRWSGRIDLQLTTRGRLAETGLELTATLDELRGELRGYPVSAAGSFAFAEGLLAIETLRAQSGPSILTLDGLLHTALTTGLDSRPDQALDLRFGLDSSDLASLYPGAAGRVQANGSVSGTLAMPRVRFDLGAGTLEIAGQAVENLSAAVDLDLAPDGRFEIQVDGQDLRLEGGRWTRVSIRGEGSRPDHRLGLRLSGDPLTAELDLRGSLAETGAYRGRLDLLRLDSPDLGVWTLQAPSPIELEWPEIAAGPVCLRHSRGSNACLEIARISSEEWTFGIELDPLDLELAAHLLPENLVLEGQAKVMGRFSAVGPVFSGSATATLAPGRIGPAAGGGQLIEISGTRLDIESAETGLSARLVALLKGIGQVDADLDLTGWRLDDPLGPGQPLAGSVRARLDGLAQLGDLFPQLSRMKGDLDADIGLAGTLGVPTLRGNARLHGGGFDVPLIGLAVSDLNLSLTAPTPDRVQVSGGADVGGGRLLINGDGAFGPAGASARIRATGDRLKVADTREYLVMVSPRLDLELTSTGGEVRGEILVPEARISPRSLPAGVVRPSRDVVIKGTDRPPAYPVDIAVELRAGDVLNIDAFGLRGRLAGSLTLTRPPGRTMVGDGRLQINDGEYRISTGFGLATELLTPLTITRGELIWVRTPIRNPGILFLAQRGTGRTVANVRVVGTLTDPQLAFFSDRDPSMSQSDVITFLLTGIPPRTRDQDYSPALAMGVWVTLNTFLEYQTGLGNALSNFRLRHDLTDRLQIEVQSGGAPSADLFWSFEH